MSYCVVQFNFHVHDSMAISSVDTGTKSAILINVINVQIYNSVMAEFHAHKVQVSIAPYLRKCGNLPI